MGAGSRGLPRLDCSGRTKCDASFLAPVTEHVPLDLIETRTFGSRVI
jgi:hypothetical protein